MGVLDGLKKLRPGSSGQALSKVDTSGSGYSQAAAEARLRHGVQETATSNWPVILVGRKQPDDSLEAERPAQPYPFYAADDAKMLKHIFNVDVAEI